MKFESVDPTRSVRRWKVYVANEAAADHRSLVAVNIVKMHVNKAREKRVEAATRFANNKEVINEA